MSVLAMLKRRNYRVFSYNPCNKLLFPPDFPSSDQDQLYQLLHSYGFRTLLKDAVLHKDYFRLKDLSRYCSPKTAQTYLDKLLQLRIAKKKDKEGFCLAQASQIMSLGETLEWYLAKLLRQELECDALWNVVLEGLPSGGDFDVLGECENHLIYLEVKSAPPKSIEKENLRAFIKRVRDLRPHLAIFFEDTTLRMKDKILPHLGEILAPPGKIAENLSLEFEKIHEETYRRGNLFITNSKPGILENIRLCLATFLREKGLT